MSHQTLEYSQVRQEVETLLKKYQLPESMVELAFEGEEICLRLFPLEIDEAAIHAGVILAKKHMDHWRIHTFEKGYISIQALNKNIFETEKILHNLKIRISALYGEKVIEFTKKGPLAPAEMNLFGAFVKRFCTGQTKDLAAAFENLGCHVYLPSRTEASLDDFAGYEEIKKMVLETVILPVKNPEVYDEIARKTRRKFECNRPKAVLFSGPPGVGKTTMARILAQESGYMLVYIPIENIMSSYYGESTRKLAEIFDLAAQSENSGMLLFLDEIDALAPSRNEKLFEATRRLLSVLLRKIDGLESRDHYITIGATNRKEDLDEALMSRFDSIVEFPLPGVRDIEAILQQYAVQLGDQERRGLAEKLNGFSPRSIKDICRRAERIQARKNIEKSRDELPDLSAYLKAAALDQGISVEPPPSA